MIDAINPKGPDNQWQVDQIWIEYYTDPLCCWSWAFEPQWRRLRFEFADQIRWRYRMGGLIPNWQHFHDPFYAVDKPLQMGPVWMEARIRTGQPIQDRIWLDNPPASSYPACMAVKCAQLQSAQAAEYYLRRLREAVMLEGRNIAQHTVLVDLAWELTQLHPSIFNAQLFEEHIATGAGQDSFRDDIQQVRFQRINRFPTLIIQGATGQKVMLVGYRPYDVLLEAIRQVAPDCHPIQKSTDRETYMNYWRQLTNRELDEALSEKIAE
ncbi:DsbA family oxidoreductase [Spirosoma litoris]